MFDVKNSSRVMLTFNTISSKLHSHTVSEFLLWLSSLKLFSEFQHSLTVLAWEKILFYYLEGSTFSKFRD